MYKALTDLISVESEVFLYLNSLLYCILCSNIFLSWPANTFSTVWHSEGQEGSALFAFVMYGGFRSQVFGSCNTDAKTDRLKPSEAPNTQLYQVLKIESDSGLWVVEHLFIAP